MKNIIFFFIIIFSSCQTVQTVKEQEKYVLLDDKILQIIKNNYGEIQNKDNLLISVKYISPFQYYSNVGAEKNHYFVDYLKKEYDKGGRKNAIYQLLSFDKNNFDKKIKNTIFKGDFFEKQIFVQIQEEIGLKKLFTGAYFKTLKNFIVFIDKNYNVFIVENNIIGWSIHFPIKAIDRLNIWYENNKNTKYLTNNENISINDLKEIIYDIFTKMYFYLTKDDIIINTTNDCNYEIKIKDLDLTFDCNSRLFYFNANVINFTEYNEDYEEQENLQNYCKNTK